MSKIMLRNQAEIGKKYGKYTIIEVFEREKGKNRRALCRCDCGTEKDVVLSTLRYGRSTSCGCLTREKLIIRNTTHGQGSKSTRTIEYNTWAGMIRRCHNPNEKFYKNYGGRGIIVADIWRYNFENFLQDMGKRPGKKYSIDRINNNGNYEPGNCRWATRDQQFSNRRPILIKSYKLECIECGKIFKAYPSASRKYCSHSCAAINITRNEKGNFINANRTPT